MAKIHNNTNSTLNFHGHNNTNSTLNFHGHNIKIDPRGTETIDDKLWIKFKKNKGVKKLIKDGSIKVIIKEVSIMKKAGIVLNKLIKFFY